MSTQQSSHLMKTTRRGRPFVKDTHDLFATLIVSLPLDTHRQFFKTYAHSFTTDEAVQNLASLKFSQSNRSPDPKDPSRIITTTTTTTFSMTRDMAKGMCQHFMDARLIENAADLTSSAFKDRGVYMLTPKGLHILERFITRNGISADHLLRVFAVQPICMKLLHLERRASDDEILITKSVIEVLFRRFVGRQPNMSKLTDEQYAAITIPTHRSDSGSGRGDTSVQEDLDRTLGIAVRRYTAPTTGSKSSASPSNEPAELVFSAVSAIDWLCDFTSLVGQDEAAEIGAHFVRYGLIKHVGDKKGRVDPGTVVVVRAGGPGGGAGAMMEEAEFRFGDKTLYKITLEGSRCARWDEKGSSSKPPSSANNSSAYNSHHPTRASEDSEDTAHRNPTGNLASATDDNMMMDGHLSDKMRAFALDSASGGGTMAGKITLDKAQQGLSLKDSHTTRLRQILEEPALRSLFREFLRSNFCEENLSFWLDVQDFKRRFNTTSSAVAAPGQGAKGLGRTHGHAAMEKHQQDLIAMAFVVYNSYLAPGSSSELNIDHNLREELVGYMNKIVAEVSAREGAQAVRGGTLDPSMAAKTLHATQLQTMVRLYERIQEYIFRLMATDSVPKFCKTERYIALMRSVGDYHEHDSPPPPEKAAAPKKEREPEVDEEKLPSRGAYVTVSQAANEKQAMKQGQAAAS